MKDCRLPTWLWAVVAVRVAAGWAWGPRPFDDAFITFRYALNLASGHGLVYNTGERVLGTTTPLWSGLLAAASAVGLAIPSAAHLLSVLADGASLIVLFLLLRTLGLPARSILLAMLLAATQLDGLTLARSGMEESLFLALLLAGLLSAARGRAAWSGVLGGLAALTRPEGLLGILAAVLVVWLSTAAASGRRGREVRSCVFAAAGVVAAWALLATWIYGSPVPQSILAKAQHSASASLGAFSVANLGLFLLAGQYGGGLLTRTWLQGNLALMLAAMLGVLAVVRGRRGVGRRLAALVLFPVGYALAMAAERAFTFYPWYYAPLYPFAAALAGLGGAWLLEWPRPHSPRITNMLVSAVVVVWVGLQLAALVVVKLPAERHEFWIQGLAASVGGVPVDRSTIVVAREIGVVGWKLWPARIVDLAGLVSPEALGREPLAVVLEVEPDYVSLRSDDGESMLRAAAADSSFQASYRVVRRVRDPYAPRDFLLYGRTPTPPR